MENVIQLAPSKWVSESVLMAITGLKKNTIKTAREKSWMEGREYKHISPDGMPMDNSMCFYDWKAVEKWIKNQPAAIPRRKSALMPIPFNRRQENVWIPNRRGPQQKPSSDLVHV